MSPSQPNLIEDYMKHIYSKCDILLFCVKSKNKHKLENEQVITPTIYDYKEKIKYNYNMPQLKKIAKHYKIKLSGNKQELFYKIFIYLHLSCYIIKIQKCFRGNLQRKYNKLHGPGYKNKQLCTNASDFMTLESLDEISYYNFISYKDSDNFVYGFHITSLYHLLYKNEKDPTNPYNRKEIPNFVFKNIKSIIKLSKILKINVNLEVEDKLVVSNEKAVEMRALTLFQTIDSLGNYSDVKWFLSLNKIELLKLVRELIDIWNYRTQISEETKMNICPPHGNPFRHLNMSYIHVETNVNNIKNVILGVLENFVNLGIDRDNRSLGSYYVLGAITLVNDQAASSIPWLYQSFTYF